MIQGQWTLMYKSLIHFFIFFIYMTNGVLCCRTNQTTANMCPSVNFVKSLHTYYLTYVNIMMGDIGDIVFHGHAHSACENALRA